MFDITNSDKEERLSNLQQKVVNTFTKHNDLSYTVFNLVSKFSELLPESLNSLVKLSDALTDALVVSGRSSLSKSIFNLDVISSSLNLNKESGSLTLNYKTDRNYSINTKKSYIQTDNKVSIYNKDKSSLASFGDLILGMPIVIETPDQYFKYTFALALEAKVVVSCLDLELDLTSSSYPLISEVYYINDNNKKVYCTILNSSDTKYDLDAERQKDNVYTILLPNIKTNKIFITLEDKDKTSVSINKIGARKLSYEAEGDVVLGPIVSNYPILKASVEALGDIDNANFYISPDLETWYEVAAPDDVPFTKDISKIVAFNTVASESLKREKDFKELYLRVRLVRKLDKESSSYLKLGRQTLTTSTTPLEGEPAEITVYEISDVTHYGATTYRETVQGSKLFTNEFSYVESKGSCYVRGFVENSYAITQSSEMLNVNITTKPLKVGADAIDAIGYEPLSANVYGYVVTSKPDRINTKVDDNIVIELKKEFVKDIYSVVQDDKEIPVDLSLGYITSALECIVSVEPEKEVFLYDSTAKLVKQLTIHPFKDGYYINLLEEDMFDLPLCSLSFNPIYPLRLNSANEFSLKDSKIISKDHLISFDSISKISTERIDFSINLSKENGNKIVLLDATLKNKYTENSIEVIKAYNATTVIKLQNKNIRKGSLILSVRND